MTINWISDQWYYLEQILSPNSVLKNLGSSYDLAMPSHSWSVGIILDMSRIPRRRSSLTESRSLHFQYNIATRPRQVLSSPWSVLPSLSLSLPPSSTKIRVTHMTSIFINNTTRRACQAKPHRPSVMPLPWRHCHADSCGCIVGPPVLAVRLEKWRNGQENRRVSGRWRWWRIVGIVIYCSNLHAPPPFVLSIYVSLNIPFQKKAIPKTWTTHITMPVNSETNLPWESLRVLPTSCFGFQ